MWKICCKFVYSDSDVSLFMVGKSGKVEHDEDFIFYNNLKHPSGAVEHLGDNRTGDGDGDDEVIMIDFTKIPEEITKIAVVVTIYDADVATTYSVLRELVLYNIKNSIIVVLNTKDGYSIINNLMDGPLSNSVFYTLKTRKDKLNICEQEYPIYGLRYTHKLQKEQPKDEDFGLYIAKVAMKNNQ